MSENVTMSDVARRAGVTRATVSFVINQRSKDQRISSSTQKKVLAAIESLNYRVNAAAQSTSRGRSFGIGVMAPGGSRLSTAWSEQVEGIHRAADARGYHVVYVGHNEPRSDTVSTPKMLQQNLVDGVIFLISTADVDGMDSAIHRYHIPTVWIQRRRKFDAIWLDEAAFIKESVAHLLAQGHQRITLIDSASEADTLWSRERRAAFEKATCRQKATLRLVALKSADVISELDGLLQEPKRSTAFLTGTPLFATYLLNLAHRRGLSVPQDVAVVAVASATQLLGAIPPLTIWDNELEQLGFRAGNMLIERIEKNAKQPALMLRGQLHPAGSTVVNSGDKNA